jgi:hypothetical protein
MAAPKGHAPYPGCETGGRPVKYTQEFIDKESDALEEWIKIKDNLFIEDFAYDRGYSDSRIGEWVKINQKFSSSIDKFKQKQKTALLKGSLKKQFHFPAASLILGHYHGIYARTDQKISGSATDPLGFIIMNIDGQTKDLVNDDEL